MCVVQTVTGNALRSGYYIVGLLAQYNKYTGMYTYFDMK